MNDKPKCCIEGCGNVAASQGHGKYRRYCERHRRMKIKPVLPAPLCKAPGCPNPAKECHRNSYYRFCDEHQASRPAKRQAGECQYPGCQSNTYKGRPLCCLHRLGPYHQALKELSYLPCSLCGWDKSFCDRDRIKPGSEGGTYRLENVRPLCPNCHRERHHQKPLGLIPLTSLIPLSTLQPI